MNVLIYETVGSSYGYAFTTADSTPIFRQSDSEESQTKQII